METGYTDKNGNKIYVGLLFSHEDCTTYRFLEQNGAVVLYNCSGLAEDPKDVDFSKVQLEPIQL